MKYMIAVFLACLCQAAAFALWRLDVGDLSFWRLMTGTVAFSLSVCMVQALCD